MIAKLASQGGGPAGASPKVFDNYLKDETVKWRTPAKEVNITTD